jgi:hypothetical protein
MESFFVQDVEQLHFLLLTRSMEAPYLRSSNNSNEVDYSGDCILLFRKQMHSAEYHVFTINH